MHFLVITFILLFIFKLVYHTHKINQIKRSGSKGDFHKFVVSGMYKKNLERERKARGKSRRKR